MADSPVSGRTMRFVGFAWLLNGRFRRLAAIGAAQFASIGEILVENALR
jgi:hypothetical protein